MKISGGNIIFTDFAQSFENQVTSGMGQTRYIEEMVEEEEEVEKDSGMGSEDSQAGSNERLLPPMEPSARYYNTFSKTFKSNLCHFH